VFVNREGDVGAAGGFLVQMMSGAEDTVMRHVERNVAALPQVTTLLRDGAAPRELLDAVLAGLDTEELDVQSTRFACSCTRERVFGAILLLGSAEIADMIARDGGAEVTCEFCAERYEIAADELRMLLAEPQGTA